MRHTPFLALSLLVALSISCGDAPTAVEDEAVQPAEELSLDLLVAGKGNGAEVSWGVFHFPPFAVEGFDCGEDVVVDGFAHTVRKDPVPGARNQHAFLTVNAQGVGIGQLTGARYIWSDKFTTYHYRGNGKAAGFKSLVHSRLIGQGSAKNISFFFNFTFVQNANGETTVEVSETRQVCK